MSLKRCITVAIAIMALFGLFSFASIAEENEELEANQANSTGDNFVDAYIAKLAEYELNGSYISIDESGNVTLSVGDGQGILLSVLSSMEQTDIANYKNWDIKLSGTGVLDLTNTSVEFQGLGCDNVPFEGTFSGSDLTLKINSTLFNSVCSKASFNNNKIQWTGEDTDVIFADKLISDEIDREISVNLVSADKPSPFIGTLSGEGGTVTIPSLNYTGSMQTDTAVFSGSRGLICCNMENGTRLVIKGFNEPDVTNNNGYKYNLNSNASNGVLVGNMNGSTLTIDCDMHLSSFILEGNNCGGLVGKAENSAVQISKDKSVDIAIEINGNNSGLIGGDIVSQNSFVSGEGIIRVGTSIVNGSDNAGILYGKYETLGEFHPLRNVSLLSEEPYQLKAGKNAGGIFGLLTIKEGGKCVVGDESNGVSQNVSLITATTDTKYGGVAGVLIGGGNSNALIVTNFTSSFEENIDPNKPRLNLIGGVVGEQNKVTVDVKNIVTNTNNYSATSFGGIVAKIGDDSLLITDNVTIKTDGFDTTTNSGGVVGFIGKKSVAYIKNSVNLSDCLLKSTNNHGQLIGYQDCSFIYGPDLEITRNSKKTLRLDNIGNYGELYRIKDFIEIDENYIIRFKHVLSIENGIYNIDDVHKFACFALSWQSRGSFNTVNGINDSNWSTLTNCSIAIKNNIDLTGLGIGGLSRDNETDVIFSGTLHGIGNKITLDIGGKDKNSSLQEGDGVIYRHKNLGLFSNVSNSASIENLTIDGNIHIAMVDEDNKLNAGGICSKLIGNEVVAEDKKIFDNVICKINIDFFSYNSTSREYKLGGLIGSVSGENPIYLNLGNDITISPSIIVQNMIEGVNTGGLIGLIEKDVPVTIMCNGAVFGGKIIYTGNNTKESYCGALVGVVQPDDSFNYKNTFNLSDIRIENLNIESDANERMGGILGGFWANTNVNIGKLKVTASSIISSEGKKTSSGGLVYRANGKWTVNECLDLTGLTINASGINKLGLLICYGNKDKDRVLLKDNDTGALYLEFNQYWNDTDDEKGYKVPSINNYSGEVFDELVAYTACVGNNKTYNTAENYGGVISLKTDNNKVNMDNLSINTYVNRSNIGTSIKTNKYSRYYYNLDDSLEKCNEDNFINNPNELLIWSVYRYADNSIRRYFSFDGADSNIVGSNDYDNRVIFDMNGLSYYPIDIIDTNVTLQNATFNFYNACIEEKEAENKLTSGDDNNHTQHYMMHCGLFRNFEASSSNRVLKVNGISLNGSVGIYNGGSGALAGGIIKGNTKESTIYTAKIILAENDLLSNGIKLENLSVYNNNSQYAPILINKIKSYSDLEANYIYSEYSTTGSFASSLIGDVGSTSETNINLKFLGTIKLDETGIFTRSLFLNTLAYRNGSAIYQFNKGKDYDSNGNFIHNATHGKEIDESVEYLNSQKHYFDYVEGTQDDDYLVSWMDENGNKSTSFSNHLPYVLKSPANDSSLQSEYHEIAVNVKVNPVLDGCGTYGHPYELTSGETLKDIANYINTGTAINGWEVNVKLDSNLHNDNENHTILKYENNGWKIDGVSTNFDVRKHLANAYYIIKSTIDKPFNLNNFPGLGVEEYPFSGVIVGANNNYQVNLLNNSKSFIRYSYGSVVRNLSIKYGHDATFTVSLSRDEWSRGNAEQSPKTFFGGVIGCIMGGDNLIENVSLSNTAFTADFSGVNTHLIPIGGYVGVISGGGVIFRGNLTQLDVDSYANLSLYNNPFVGRVLNGFAFYEGEDNVPNNTDKNYKINKLIPKENETDIVFNSDKLIINNKQGLLILSSIVNSGGGSQSSYAYSYNKGKIRNALYTGVGTTENVNDYGQTIKDETIIEGKPLVRYSANDSDRNLPYLLTKYASVTSNSPICSTSTNGIIIEFKADGSFNMAGYDNGYRGISTRYVSNAVFSIDKTSASDTQVDASLGIVRVKKINGNNATISNINMNVYEYNNDDFHIASMGGLFNIVWTKQKGGGTAESIFAENLTVSSSTVSLKYVDNNRADANQADKNLFLNEDGFCCVTVGGIFGSLNDAGNTATVSGTSKDTSTNYLINNLHINSSTIVGANSAGGLIGATSMAKSGLSGYPGILLSNKTTSTLMPSFLNCSYNSISVTSKLASGGFVGMLYANNNAEPNFSSLGVPTGGVIDKGAVSSVTVTQDNFITGNASTIKTESSRSYCGGLFGGTGSRVLINNKEINNYTGLNIASGDLLKEVVISNVNIYSGYNNTSISSNKNGSEGSSDGTTSGGLIGRIGNINSVLINKAKIINCKITSLKNEEKCFGGSGYSGGLVGIGYINSARVSSDNTQILGTEIYGESAGGFLGYGYQSSFTFAAQNSIVKDCSINGVNTGGVVGKGYGKYLLYNILIQDSDFSGTNKYIVSGTSNVSTLNAVGISLFADPEKNINIPSSVEKYTEGFVVFSNHLASQAQTENFDNPYVVSNPAYALKVEEDNEQKVLIGDSVAYFNNKPLPQLIIDNAKEAKNNGNMFKYSNIQESALNRKYETASFNAVQGSGPSDLPLLLIKGFDGSLITDYLDVITNNGFSASNSKTVSISTYYYNQSNGTFRHADSTTLLSEPQSIRYDGSNFRIVNNGYDNTRNRFTLIEVTFSMLIDGATKQYTLSLPIAVIRELQYNSIVTLSYGNEFNQEVFKNLHTHLLESTGNPFTAYLTFQYNREEEKFVDYDWQGFIDGGGNMFEIDKTISFSTSIPEGTNLILLDCQNGNKAYKYVVQSEDNGENGFRANLSGFSSVTDDSEMFVSSTAQPLAIEAYKDDNGIFVRCDKDDNPTLKLNDGFYYRLYEEGDDDKYSLTVPNLSSFWAEENYYLVVDIPVPAQGDESIMNGYISLSLDWMMPSKGTAVHRDNFKNISSITGNPVGSNDESSYNISSGYKQELLVNEDVVYVDLTDSNKKMQVEVVDAISFFNSQDYDDNDKLFYKLDISAKTFENNKYQETQFPVGTSGTVYFYIQDEEGNYYYRVNDAWTKGDKNIVSECSYFWESNGSNMELLLSEDGENAIDLSGVRKLIKGGNNNGYSKILITAKMEVEFAGKEVMDMIVPDSDQNGTDKHVVLNYTGKLSTQSYSLDYSSLRISKSESEKYYLSRQYKASLSLDASKIDQLGINRLELVPDYIAKHNGKDVSIINLTAALNLSDLKDIEEVLRNTDSIVFNLELYRRDGSDYSLVSNKEDYIEFDKGYTWTYSKDVYYDDNKIVTNEFFDGVQFTIPIIAYINTDVVDFANYKVVLSVTFNGSVTVECEIGNAYIVYTYASIMPSFYNSSDGS